jgi:hypothetical protein
MVQALVNIDNYYCIINLINQTHIQIKFIEYFN